MLTGAKSRRSHHKSRNGCEECKLRRNKCDEQGYPDGPCAACVIRGTACVYRRGPQAPTRPSTLAQGSGSRNETQSVPEGGQQSQVTAQDDRSSMSSYGPGQMAIETVQVSPLIVSEQAQSLRIQELRLMHYWCTQTSHSTSSIASHIAHLGRWRIQISNLAFEFPFLLNTILAVTSVHLATQGSNATTVSSHISTAIQYQTLALTEFRAALEQLSPENCDAVLACAVLNMICAHVSSQLPTAVSDHICTPLEAVPVLFDALTGISSIVRQCKPWLTNVATWNELGFTAEDAPRASGTGNLGQWMQADMDEIKIALLRLERLLGSVTVNDRLIYGNAITKLESFSLRGTGMITGWLVACGSIYMEHIRTQKPVALMILLHWSVLLLSTPFEWWTRFLSPRLTRQLETMLRSSGGGGDWTDAIGWCRIRSDFALALDEVQ